MIRREEIVDVGGIPTYLLTIGSGPPVLVVHGGPGFDQGYLLPTLSGLAINRTLVFYDQPGCGRTPSPPGGIDPARTFRHFADLVDRLDAPRLGLIAHSWGSVVALGGAASGMRRRVFDEGLLVTPIPTRKAALDQVSRNLFQRFPARVADRYGELLAEGDEAKLLELILPYYLATPRPAPEIGLRMNLATFLSIFPCLGDFDLGGQLGLFARCAVLLAERDITTADLVDDILAATTRRFDLAGVGHFPGNEDPDGFAAILEAAFCGANGFPMEGGVAHSRT